MRLTLRRDKRTAESPTDRTLGRLSVDGLFFCDTLEPTDRGLTAASTPVEVTSAKVAHPARVAIPTGSYALTLAVRSPSMGDRVPYAAHAGRIPRLVGVTGFLGILIHVGNFPRDTRGCILVGRRASNGNLLRSRETYEALFAVLERARRGGEEIWIDIVATP